MNQFSKAGVRVSYPNINTVTFQQCFFFYYGKILNVKKHPTEEIKTFFQSILKLFAFAFWIPPSNVYLFYLTKAKR